MLRIDPDTGRQKWFRSEGAKSVLSAVISILIGMAVGTLIIIAVGLTKEGISTKGIGEGIRLVFLGVFSTGRSGGTLTFGYNPVNLGNMLFRATPLIMTGLSVAVAFKTGLFNIGAAGQYLMGTMGTLTVGLVLGNAGCPVFIAWIAAFLAGMLLGALWGAIPGVFKAYLNINEVITCIMTNWIAANLVTWWFDSHEIFKNAAEGGKIGYIIPLKNVGVVTPKLGMNLLFPGSQANGGFWIACILAVAMFIMLTRTTFGYELRACGSNRHAARYAGINDKRNIILSMMISGALAAAGAALYYLSGNTEFFWSTYQSLPAEGFNGIPVALLASNNPVAVIFTGVFMSMLNVAGTQLKSLTAYNEYISDIIIAVIVYLSAFSMLIKQVLNGREKKKGGNK
ncbi:MAG: ABC transporter permease [Firmicutes bacterium]|nr:ABC transporter permease [Bacillota bacterium]MDD7602855.1 ABC transporter permease [Bacillota bacterium]MDY5855798.1 ABC transporter permease [Anaerovoracaceae bacterium]